MEWLVFCGLPPESCRPADCRPGHCRVGTPSSASTLDAASPATGRQSTRTRLPQGIGSLLYPKPPQAGPTWVPTFTPLPPLPDGRSYVLSL